MKITSSLKAAPIFLLLLAGCSVTGSLHRRGYNASVVHTPKQLREDPAKEYQPDYIKIEHIDGRPTEFYVPTTTLENGEQVMCMQIQEVVVVAKSRSLPERLGKVDIDFVVTLPKKLQGTCRSVIVTPVLHNQGKDTPLEDLTIRGGLFSKVQQRDYWQYQRYLDVYHPDDFHAMLAYDRFIKYPYPEGVRLDSIVEHTTDLSYHYTQSVSTAEAGKTMRITLEGKVIGLDDSYYRLPPSDTLDYHISSMLTFADTTTRYVKRIIEKYAQVQDKNYLSFRVNDTRILDTLGSNPEQLKRITSLMDQLINQKEFYLDSIVLTAASSPEGYFARNDQLARARGFSLRDYLIQKFPGAGVDTMITVRWIPEAWEELKVKIAADERITQREKILALIDNNSDPDRRESELRRLYPADYRYIRQNIYPLLRSVSFKYDLRRVGMIKDTVITTEIDTTYLRGRQLLENRRYREALEVFRPYDDRNMAIALLSLGYDEHAYEILCREPVSAIREYLQAIACVRMKRYQDALTHYNEAIRMEPNLAYRGKLDPEISSILKD